MIGSQQDSHFYPSLFAHCSGQQVMVFFLDRFQKNILLFLKYITWKTRTFFINSRTVQQFNIYLQILALFKIQIYKIRWRGGCNLFNLGYSIILKRLIQIFIDLLQVQEYCLLLEYLHFVFYLLGMFFKLANTTQLRSIQSNIQLNLGFFQHGYISPRLTKTIYQIISSTINHKSKGIIIRLKEWINLLFEIVICLQTVITILFWVVLYDYSKPFQTVSFLKQIGIHGFPFICLLFDLFFNTYQFPARHLIIVLAIGTCYLILNLCYSLVIRPIYAPLDWVSMMCYIYIVLCFTLVLAVHNLIRIYWQRQRKQYLCEKSNDQKYIKFPSELQQVNN